MQMLKLSYCYYTALLMSYGSCITDVSIPDSAFLRY